MTERPAILTQRKAAACRVLSLSLLVCLLSSPAGAVELAVAASEELPPPVRAILSRRQLPDDSLSLMVYDLEAGRSVLQFNSDTQRNPASVMKLVTTLVALDVLGPAYQWRTEAWLEGELDDGRLAGDLLLKGYGDPYLVTERIWLMLRELRRRGLREIDGDLLLDDSFFDTRDHDPAAFDRRPLRSYNVAPNALLMNFKAARYFFEPDVANNAVNIRMDPTLENLKIVNRLTVRRDRCRGYQRGIAIIPNDSYNELTFSGQFPSGCNVYAMTRSALSHNEYTYGVFRSLWQELGGQIGGGFRNVTFEADEDDEPFLRFDSVSLAEAITRVNKFSNNVMARHLLLTVAAETLGAPASEADGREAVRQWMAGHGFDPDELELSNGAGLSRSARVSARLLTDLLRYAYTQSYMPEFLSSMSLTGLDGTTARRFAVDDPLAGRAHLKTGSLDHVSAIAGYVHARSGRRYIVAVLQNFPDVHRGYGEEVQSSVLRWVHGL